MLHDMPRCKRDQMGMIISYGRPHCILKHVSGSISGVVILPVFRITPIQLFVLEPARRSYVQVFSTIGQRQNGFGEGGIVISSLDPPIAYYHIIAHQPALDLLIIVIGEPNRFNHAAYLTR